MDVIVLAASGILAFLLNIAATPVIISISHKRKLYDHPNGRKIHTYPIPRLGGIGIFFSTLIPLIAVPAIVPLILGNGTPYPLETRHLFILAGLLIVYSIGLVDDLRNLRARLKFAFQIVAAVLVMAGGFTIHTIRIIGIGALDLGLFAYPITLLWIVGAINALNFVDGVDGFAGGIAGFAALSLGVISLIQGQTVTALLAFTLLGAIAAFLIFNFPPGRIFMGDSGAYLLGFALSVLPLLDMREANSFVNLGAAATLLTIPILDTASAIVRRLRGRKSIGAPDREHIHHKLLDIGLKDKRFLVMAYGYSMFLSAASIAAAIIRSPIGFLIFLAAWSTSIVAYILLARMQKKTTTPASDTLRLR